MLQFALAIAIGRIEPVFVCLRLSSLSCVDLFAYKESLALGVEGCKAIARYPSLRVWLLTLGVTQQLCYEW